MNSVIPFSDEEVKGIIKFTLNVRGDGFVLIDVSSLGGLTDGMLYEMDILLDVSGRSELIYDFPGEKWSEVWVRETQSIRAFCESGKMLLWLMEDFREKECEMEYDEGLEKSSKWLYVPSGKLLAVEAGELIQCLAYPGLEMEKVFELTLPKGWYAFSDEGVERLRYCSGTPAVSVFDNIQEIRRPCRKKYTKEFRE